MENKGKTVRLRWAAFVLGVLFCAMFFCGAGMAAESDSAAENGVEDGSASFDIDALLLPSGNTTYDIQLTVSNLGEDWEGTVRAQLSQQYGSLSCAYDTELSLPQGSTKQFVVRVPISSIDEPNGSLEVFLLDKRVDKIVGRKSFRRFLLDGVEALSMGILSDSYRSLTYLDRGGETVYYGGAEFPISLVQLDQDNLAGSLDFLKYLVIDNYNTGVLTDEAREGIRQWMNAGGMLIVGTGKRAEDTLGGLDFLDIECTRVYEPGTNVYGGAYGVGLEQLSLAELNDTTGRYHTEQDSMIMVSSWGDGAAEIVPYALSDLGKPDLVVENWENYVWELLANVNSYVNISDDYSDRYNMNYIVRSIFRSFGNGGGSLNFGALKWLVVLYVIFVGPVLYLILRAIKKRDWYWGAVPVTVLVGILLVYLAGRGFEVVDTRVYSVTVEKLSGRNTGSSPGGDSVTYLHCYDAGHEEWAVQLAERYDYAGPLFENYVYASAYGVPASAYFYHICREGGRLSLGIDPDQGFADAYFRAGTSRKVETGSISGDLADSVKWGITGTVTNGTGWDFEYFAVIADNVLYIYDALPAGATRTLGKAVYTSRQSGYDTVMEAYRHGYMSDYVYGSRKKDRNKDYDIIAALGTGIWEVFSREDSGGKVIIGVARNWEKAVDDDCSETAYGCLYAVQ